MSTVPPRTPVTTTHLVPHTSCWVLRRTPVTTTHLVPHTSCWVLRRTPVSTTHLVLGTAPYSRQYQTPRTGLVPHTSYEAQTAVGFATWYKVHYQVLPTRRSVQCP
eukprot:820405-Rhodomonas_salina.2